ncbi:hypothetical protein MAPG_08838 [Magnaporthiopsis poae ATCC 64411]|uniref:Uncharacterized protein n=1 Tax=Magnaporthiopsis poae (strain ATCC 64411 / 73-15) TaxID=644358 RepID=A0A0C4E8D7_MAGP6|nr:hypothetical protein MAPG_08838 [Magnaporthiopsis poae ATCC 64411]
MTASTSTRKTNKGSKHKHPRRTTSSTKAQHGSVIAPETADAQGHQGPDHVESLEQSQWGQYYSQGHQMSSAEDFAFIGSQFASCDIQNRNGQH